MTAVYANATGGLVSMNTYNALGQRVEDMTPTSTTDEAYGAGGNLLVRYTGDSNSRSFVPFNGRILAEYYCGGMIFDHPDEIGSATTATDCTGSLVNGKLYYPFGEFWTGYAIPNLGMHQEFALLPDYDPETDQYNTANRHYSPMGRWLSPDPFMPQSLKKRDFLAWISDPQHWDKYAYARNNPTTLTDPSGLNACGTNDDSTCKVTVTLTSRPKDGKGKYDDQFKNIKGQQNYNATAVVSVNGVAVATFLARTTPSDSGSFATVANGTYDATFTTHNGDVAIRLQPTNSISVVNSLDPATGKSYAEGILIHASGQTSDYAPLGYTGMYYSQKTDQTEGASEGCVLICRSAYGLFGQMTGLTPDSGTPQQNFTVVVDTNENPVFQPY